MTNKKLGLLLCPLLPLTAIGIVEIAGTLSPMTDPPPVCETRETRVVHEIEPPSVQFSTPPKPSLPAPEPAPLPTAPRSITSD